MIEYGKEARSAIIKGMNKAAQAVKVTLGPKGRTVIIGRKFNTPIVTNDGATILKNMTVEDEFESLGLDLIKQASFQTNDDVGDGTTSSVVLAAAIIENFVKHLEANLTVNMMELRDELETAANEVVEILNKDKSMKFSFLDVARIACKNEDDAQIVSKVFEEVGVDGNVILENSQSAETSIEVMEGMKINRGLVSPYLLNGEKTEAVDCPVLVMGKALSSLEEIIPVAENEQSILIIADDFDEFVLQKLITFKMNGNITPILIKAPGYGKERPEILEDIASLTGATVTKAPKKEDLGRIKVVADMEKTILIGGDASKRVEVIKNMKGGEWDAEKLKQRITNLQGKVATIYVGGATEVEQGDRKLRIDDAVSACRSTVDGVVLGGGIALMNASAKLNVKSKGAAILAESIKSPFRQIAENCGCEPDNWENGFDFKTGMPVDGYTEGIVDPFNVTKSTLLNAVSVAKTVITTECAMVEKKKK